MSVNYDVKNKAIWSDIEDILYPSKDEGPRDGSYSYKLIIHTPGSDLEVMKLEALDINRDYVKNVSEFALVRCYLPLGVYLQKLAQYRELIEVSIYKIPISASTFGVRMDKKRIVKRYRAIFRSDLNALDSGNEFSTLGSFSKDLTGLAKVYLELHSRQFEIIRVKTTSCTLEKKTYEDILRGVITAETDKILIDGKPSLDCMDIVKPDNKEPNKITIVPSLTPIVNLPTYLQEQMNGVYAYGIGSFIQHYREKNTWFVYPLYRVDRFKDDIHRAIFYSLPSNIYSGIDRTYVENGKLLKVAVSGHKSYKDNAELGMVNDGLGIRMTDHSVMMKKPWEIDADKGPKGISSKLNNEFIVKNKSDGVNFARYRRSDTHSNPFFEASRTAYHQTAQVDLEWQNGDIDLLYPGMPIKYVFIEEGVRREVNGTLLSAYSVTSNQGQTVGINGHFMTTVGVSIVVEPYRRKGIDK